INTFVCPSDPTSGTVGKGANINTYGLGSTNYYGNVMVMRINKNPSPSPTPCRTGPRRVSRSPSATRIVVTSSPTVTRAGPAGETTAFPDGDPLDTPIYGANYARSLGVAGGLWVDPTSPPTVPARGATRLELTGN